MLRGFQVPASLVNVSFSANRANLLGRSWSGRTWGSHVVRRGIGQVDRGW